MYASKMTVMKRGDTLKQAILRDKIIKKGKAKNGYISKILHILKQEMKFLDIGYARAHRLR